MDKSLGIYVTSEQHLDLIVELCRAANRSGVEVNLFFTHLGTKLCTDPRLDELQDIARIALCKVGFEDHKLDRSKSKLKEEAYSSQSWHAEMIYDCDRYLTF